MPDKTPARPELPLEQCPFCGGKAAVARVGRDWWRLMVDHDPFCVLEDVGDVPQTDDMRIALIDAWNHRPHLEALLADERRKVLEEIRRPVLDAINLLTLDADALRECSTHFDGTDYDWTGEPDAKADYERMMRTVAKLRGLIDMEPT
jgi:hypothetical protein